MTCLYFSRNDEKLVCNVYGVIDASQEKIQECHERYFSCLEEAKRVKERREKEERERIERMERKCQSFSESRIPIKFLE